MGVFRTAEEVNVLTVSELMVRFFEVDGEDSRRKIFRRAQNESWEKKTKEIKTILDNHIFKILFHRKIKSELFYIPDTIFQTFASYSVD